MFRNVSIAVILLSCQSALAAKPRVEKSDPARRGDDLEKTSTVKLGAEKALWESLEAVTPKSPSKLENIGIADRAINFVRGLPRGKTADYLRDQVAQAEKAWGEPVTRLKEGAVPGFLDFRAEKAAALKLFGRKPSEVTEGFLSVGASTIRIPVLGDTAATNVTIDPRKIFYQRWQPKAGVEPSGVVWLVSPGFEETGRTFYEQIDWVNRLGDDVIVMDHQWTGYTQPEQGAKNQHGTMDRGFGVARDVLAGETLAQAVGTSAYGAKARVIVLGDSMGSGPGAYGAAALLNGIAKVDLKLAGQAEGLDLASLPKPAKVDLALESPFFGYTKNLTNDVDAVVGETPGLRDVDIPHGESDLGTNDPRLQRWREYDARDGSVEQAKTLVAAQPDLAILKQLVAAKPFDAHVAVIQGNADRLANPTLTRQFLAPVADRTRMDWFKTNLHPLPNTPQKRTALLEARAWLLASTEK